MQIRIFRVCLCVIALFLSAGSTLVYGSDLPLPYSIWGMITVDEVLLNQGTSDSLVIGVTRNDGTQFYDASGVAPLDSGGLNSSNRYVLDIPMYAQAGQAGGAAEGDNARIDIMLDSSILSLRSPLDGQFLIGSSGSTANVNISAVKCGETARIGEIHYQSMQSSYDNVADGERITAAAVLTPEDLIADRDVAVTISGGHDCSLSRVVEWGATSLNSLVISSGSVDVDHLTIRTLEETVGLPPAAPGSFICAASGPATIHLSWTDDSGNESGYRLYMSTAPDKPGSPVSVLGTNVTGYDSTALAAGTLYYYWIEAYNSYGTSAALACSSRTIPGSGGGTGSGDTASDPKVINLNGAMGEKLFPGQSRYYKFNIDAARIRTSVYMASVDQNADCNMLLMEGSNDTIDSKYTSTLSFYSTNRWWGSNYGEAGPPRIWAAFSGMTSGESIRIQGPYDSTAMFVKIKNESPNLTAKYNFGFDQAD